MKFEEFRKITPLHVPPPTEDEVNEAFEALGPAKFTPLIILADEVVFRRCVQCAYFSVVTKCPVCTNHPMMLPVNFMKMGQQMESVGRVCSYNATQTCIEKIAKKQDWCEDCRTFWDREFDCSPPRILVLPEGINPALKPRVVTGEVVDAETQKDQEEWEDELEETTDNLYLACNLLSQVKYLLDYIAHPGLTPTIQEDNRREMRNFSAEITKVLEQCDFEDPFDEEVEDPNTAFSQRDKELLDGLAEAGDEYPQMLD